ncbi:O-antigen ligase family protein [Candidatus Microgenomates bacterium]|nr:O-antigen ligase family protein [Candidatus Microgenomates bacterium]
MEYLTYSLYGFDILLVAALAIWGINITKNKIKIKIGDKYVFFSFLALLFFSLISILSAEYFFISLYYVFVLCLGSILYLFVLNKIKNINRLEWCLKIFIYAVFIQSLIAIGQFINNGYLGLHFLGEQFISADNNGVAKITLDGIKHIRAYGTLPHPNILAFFILVAGFFNFYFLFQQKKWRQININLAIAAIFSLAILFTFSRMIWIIAFLMWPSFIYMTMKVANNEKSDKTRHLEIVYALSAIILALLLYAYPLIVGRMDFSDPGNLESFQIRSILQDKALIMINDNILGVGLGNFTIDVAYLLTGYPTWVVQPVHNTFLLTLAELGVGGFLSLIGLCFFVLKLIKKTILPLSFSILALFPALFFDHYLWDIRQGFFLFILIISFSVAYSDNKKRYHE